MTIVSLNEALQLPLNHAPRVTVICTDLLPCMDASLAVKENRLRYSLRLHTHHYDLHRHQSWTAITALLRHVLCFHLALF